MREALMLTETAHENPNQQLTESTTVRNGLRSCQGHTPALGERVWVDPSAVVIGDVVIGDDSSIWPQAVVRGDVHSLRIGARTSVQDGSVLHVTHVSDYTPKGFPLTVGDDVTVGHGVTLHRSEERRVG